MLTRLLISFAILAATGCQADRATLLFTANLVPATSAVKAGVYPNTRDIAESLQRDSIAFENITFAVDTDDSTENPDISAQDVHVKKLPVGSDKKLWIIALSFPNRPARIVASSPGCEPLKWDYDPEGTDLAAAGDHIFSGFRAFVLKKSAAKGTKELE